MYSSSFFVWLKLLADMMTGDTHLPTAATVETVLFLMLSLVLFKEY
jgi:hypothetical protein